MAVSMYQTVQVHRGVQVETPERGHCNERTAKTPKMSRAECGLAPARGGIPDATDKNAKAVCEADTSGKLWNCLLLTEM